MRRVFLSIQSDKQPANLAAHWPLLTAAMMCMNTKYGLHCTGAIFRYSTEQMVLLVEMPVNLLKSIKD